MARDPQLRVRPGPPLRAALRASGDNYPTGRLNAIAERYLAIVEEQRPALSRSEWLAVFDALNGVGSHDFLADSETGHVPPRVSLALEIADADRLNQLGEKWHIDADALSRRLHGMTVAQRIAVVETAQRFWALAALDTGQALDLATQHPASWPAPAEGE